MKSRGPPNHAEEHGLVSQIAGDLELGEGSSLVGFCVAEENDELELDYRRRIAPFQLVQGEQTAAWRQGPTYFSLK